MNKEQGNPSGGSSAAALRKKAQMGNTQTTKNFRDNVKSKGFFGSVVDQSSSLSKPTNQSDMKRPSSAAKHQPVMAPISEFPRTIASAKPKP